MTPGSIGQVPGSPASPRTPEQASLRKACAELEAAFLRQLLESMRETAPKEEGLFGRSSGEEMFSSLLDDRLASLAAEKMTRGLGEALYRQLSRRLEDGGSADPTQ